MSRFFYGFTRNMTSSKMFIMENKIFLHNIFIIPAKVCSFSGVGLTIYNEFTQNNNIYDDRIIDNIFFSALGGFTIGLLWPISIVGGIYYYKK